MRVESSRSAPPSLTQNTLWMMSSLAIRLVLQAIYFIIIARALGPEQYGAFISVKALVAIIAPFVGLGSGNLLIKNTARDPQLFNVYWGNALVVIVSIGLGGIFALSLTYTNFLHESIPIGVVVLIALSDLIFERVIDAAGKSFQAFQLLKKTGLINIAISSLRLVAAISVVFLFLQVQVVDWSYFYLGSSIIGAALAVFWVCRDLGPPKVDVAKLKPEAAEGFFFSVSMSGQNVHNVIDKVMLARLSSLEAAGTYGVAYRLVEIAMVPVRALLQAAYTRFFKQGETGVSGSYQLARRLSPFPLVYGFVAAISIFFLAPAVPLILGEKYHAAVLALQWMAPLPLLKTIHFIASDTLSGAGIQGARSLAILASAILNFISNLWLIPLYSWEGAAWSSLGTNSFLAVSLWAIVYIHCRHETASANTSV